MATRKFCDRCDLELTTTNVLPVRDHFLAHLKVVTADNHLRNESNNVWVTSEVVRNDGHNAVDLCAKCKLDLYEGFVDKLRSDVQKLFPGQSIVRRKELA